MLNAHTKQFVIFIQEKRILFYRQGKKNCDLNENIN